MLHDAIAGIDIESGNPNSLREARYSLSVYQGEHHQEYTKLDLDSVMQILETYQPIYLASDNIFELIPTKTDVISLTSQLPNGTGLVQVTRFDNFAFPLSSLIRLENLQTLRKPGALMTAEFCAILASKGYGQVFDPQNSSWKNLPKFNDGQVIRDLLAMRDRQKSVYQDLIDEHTNRNSLDYLRQHHRIKEVVSIIGEGKEAAVYLAKDSSDQMMVIKLFKQYSPVAKILHRGAYRVSHLAIAINMAKKEAKNLIHMHASGIPVPHLIFQDGPIVAMEAIINGEGLAPTIAQTKLTDHNEIQRYMEQGLDILLELFQGASIVHGDFSPQNLLIRDNQIVLIDVRQAQLINTKTFIDTPVRLRMDKSLELMKQDIDVFLSYFEKKYRMSMDREHIFSQFRKAVPKHLQDKL